MKRRLLLPLLGIGLGLAVALFAHSRLIPGGGVDRLTPNIWTVIAVPLGLALSLVALHPRRWPAGLGWSSIVYVGCIFLAARIELLVMGNRDEASSASHQLYFQLVPWLQTMFGLLVAFWLGWRVHLSSTERTTHGA